MGERGGVHHDAGHERRGERAVALVERDAEAVREERDHLARRGGSGIDPVVRADPVIGDVVVNDDDRDRVEQRAVPVADAPDALGRRTVDDDGEVVPGVRIGIRSDRRDAGEEVVQRRRRVRGDDVGPVAEGAGDPGNSERRSERIGVRILVTDGEDMPGRARWARSNC
jgi:hypothetical protein